MDRRYFLLGTAAAAWALTRRGQAAPDLSARVEDGVLWVRHGERPILAYRHRAVEAPAGLDRLMTRSAYIHPLHAPCGVVLTDDFAASHPHQRGVFFAWTKTTIEELHPDFWNLGSGTARIRSEQVRLHDRSGEPVRFDAEHVWEMRRGDTWEAMLDETWEVTVQRPTFTDPNDAKAAYVFDLTSRQKPRVRMELPQHLYGGMAVRAAAAWVQKNSGAVVLTSEGKDRVGAEASPARWVDMSGPINGKEAGIALLEHPSTPRAPNLLRVHPDVPYYVFSLPKAASFTLEAGKEYVFRYRVVVHNGRGEREMLEGLWKEFAKMEN